MRGEKEQALEREKKGEQLLILCFMAGEKGPIITTNMILLDAQFFILNDKNYFLMVRSVGKNSRRMLSSLIWVEQNNFLLLMRAIICFGNCFSFFVHTHDLLLLVLLLSTFVGISLFPNFMNIVIFSYFLYDISFGIKFVWCIKF